MLTFATSALLPSVPPVDSVVIEVTPRGGISSVDVQCNPLLTSMDVIDPQDFVLTYDGNQESPFSLAIVDGMVRLFRNNWEEAELFSFIEYAASPGSHFYNATGGVLVDFELPIPFP